MPRKRMRLYSVCAAHVLAFGWRCFMEFLVEDQKWMSLALEEARMAADEGEIPVGIDGTRLSYTVEGGGENVGSYAVKLIFSCESDLLTSLIYFLVALKDKTE